MAFTKLNCSSGIVWALLLLGLSNCTPPIRQFDLKNQSMTCDEASRFAHDTLKGMRYTITSFTPASPGRPGIITGTTDERERSGSATVVVTCDATGPTIDASEDGRWLGQIDFKRGFYLTFTGVVSQRRALDKIAKEQAALPVEQRKQQGLEAVLTPVTGLDARMEISANLGAAGVLPVRVVINNRTRQRYRLDPNDIVMVRADGERVRPLDIAAVVERVRNAPPPSASNGASPPDLSSLPQQLQRQLFTTTEMRPDATAQGYLFYPLAAYTRARVLATETQSEETEGFVVEF